MESLRRDAFGRWCSPGLAPGAPATHIARAGGDAAGGGGVAVPRAATTSPRDAGGGGGALGDPPADAEALLGRRVVRDFDGELCEGVIKSVRHTSKYGTLWMVDYAADADQEELNWPQLGEALQPDAQRTRADQGASQAAHARESTPALQLAAAAGGQGGAAAVERYKGVSRLTGSHTRWRAVIGVSPDCRLHLGTFGSASEAAEAYDAAARKHGKLEVNFPAPGTQEAKAVWRPGNEYARTTRSTFKNSGNMQRAIEPSAAAALPPPPPQRPGVAAAAHALPPAHAQEQYFGVYERPHCRFRAYPFSIYLGMHDTAEQAARAVDAKLRELAHEKPELLRKLNFPRGAAECAAKAPGATLPAAASKQPALGGGRKHARSRSADAPQEEEEVAPAKQQQKAARTEQAREEAAPPARASTAAASPAPASTRDAPAAAPPPPAAAAVPTASPSHAAAASPAASPPLLVPAPAALQHAPHVRDADAAAAMPPPPSVEPSAEREEGDADAAAVAAIVRSIHLAPRQLDTALAAIQRSGVRLAQLESCASPLLDAATRVELLARAAGKLGISDDFGQMAFAAALTKRVARGGSAA